MKSIKEEVDNQLRNLATLSDQTAVHRKKFEFSMVILRKFVNIYFSETTSKIERFNHECIDEILSFFQEFMSILSQNVLQTWTLPTIENEPNFILEQLTGVFDRFANAMGKCGDEFREALTTKPDDWKEYNILDLRAISASFTQYLKTGGVSPQIANKVGHRLQTINVFLAENDENEEANAGRMFSPIPVIYRQWRVDYSDFIELKEIGMGVSAHVYRGVNKNTQEEVAIKKFFFRKLNSARFQSYQREVAALATAQHPSLLRLVGATDSEPYCIITEWMTGGSLYHAIHRLNYFSQTDRSIAALDIARGMQFLHSRKIVHRDLKTLNVLLNSNKKVKICDFGFSRFAESKTEMTASVGTPHWMAPEILERGAAYTSKVDVYAYGVVLWEMATSQTPYEGMDADLIIERVRNDDLRPTLPENMNPKMRDLITVCWDRDPNIRPTFDEIVNMIQTEKIVYDGTDMQVYENYVKLSATRGEIIQNLISEKATALQNKDISISDFLAVIESNGLPHTAIEHTWEVIEEIVPEAEQIADYTKLLIKFIHTSKLSEVVKKQVELPNNSIPNDVVTKLVYEIPTGSPEVDHSICIIASKNKCAPLFSLYSTNPADIALSLEVCSIEGVDFDLVVGVTDKCVQSLSSKNDALVAASIRCLLSLGESKRISINSLASFVQSQSEIIRNLALVAMIKNSQFSMEIPEEVIELSFSKLNENELFSYLLISACKNVANAKKIIEKLRESMNTLHLTDDFICKVLVSSLANDEMKKVINESLSDFILSDENYKTIAQLCKE